MHSRLGRVIVGSKPITQGKLIPKTWKYLGHIDSKGRMRQVFKEIRDCKEILGHGLETDPRQKGEIGWIVRLLLRIIGGTIPLKPIGNPPPLPAKSCLNIVSVVAKMRGGGTLTLGATIYAFLRVQFVKHIVLTPPINLSYCDRFSSFWTKELLRHRFRGFRFVCFFREWGQVVFNQHFKLIALALGTSPQTKMFSFWHCPKRGGGPAQIWGYFFKECIFGQLKESISSKMPIIWILNWSLGCLYEVFLVLNLFSNFAH